MTSISLNWVKEALRWCATVGLMLTTPFWLPIAFLLYGIRWRGMWEDIVKFHESLWRS